MLKELVTNVKPIGNGLVKSVTHQCTVSNGLLKSITDRCRIGNGLWCLLPIILYWRRMLVGCVSFDCHPGSPFFSHQRRMLLSRLCLILPTPLTLSPQKATPVPTTTLALSPQKVTRSICVLRCPAVLSHSPLPAAHALRIISLLRKPALQQSCRSRVRGGERGQSGCRPRRPPRCRRGRDAASDPPPRP
jgi:hypothetical protein